MILNIFSSPNLSSLIHLLFYKVIDFCDRWPYKKHVTTENYILRERNVEHYVQMFLKIGFQIQKTKCENIWVNIVIIQIVPSKPEEKEGKWGHIYFDSAFKGKRKGERKWKKEVLECSGAPEWLTTRSNLKDKKANIDDLVLCVISTQLFHAVSCFVYSISKCSFLTELCLYWIDFSLMKCFAAIQLITFISYFVVLLAFRSCCIILNFLSQDL